MPGGVIGAAFKCQGRTSLAILLSTVAELPPTHKLLFIELLDAIQARAKATGIIGPITGVEATHQYIMREVARCAHSTRAS